MKPNFCRRSHQPELMDTDVVSFLEFHECLTTLESINIGTLAYRPTLKWFKHLLATTDAGKALSVLDVGCGGGDMLRQVLKLSQKLRRKLTLKGIDLNPYAKKSAEILTPKHALISYETADLFSVKDRRSDFIISSLFTHHLTKDECIKFIRWMDQNAMRGWFINDLHRHWLPYWAIKCATRFLFSNRLITHDAPVSVARAFTAADWREYLQEAGISLERARIEWFFPFRYGIACHKR